MNLRSTFALAGALRSRRVRDDAERPGGAGDAGHRQERRCVPAGRRGVSAVRAVGAGRGAAPQAVNDRAAAGAVATSAVGAATGAIIGSVSNQGGQGAAIGAGLGLLFGAINAANASSAAQWQLQQQYDNAYLQCMYARGNQVPVRMSQRGEMTPRDPQRQRVSAAAPAYPPPNTPPPYPPPNTPPPYPPPAPAAGIPPPDTPPPRS